MAEWVTLCSVSDLPPGVREVFGVNNLWIAIFNVGGKFYAIEDLCTHDGNVLAFDLQDRPSTITGHEIECPRHGGRFDLRTGKATRSPAEIDVPWFEVRIMGDDLQVLV